VNVDGGAVFETPREDARCRVETILRERIQRRASQPPVQHLGAVLEAVKHAATRTGQRKQGTWSSYMSQT